MRGWFFVGLLFLSLTAHASLTGLCGLATRLMEEKGEAAVNDVVHFFAGLKGRELTKATLGLPHEAWVNPDSKAKFNVVHFNFKTEGRLHDVAIYIDATGEPTMIRVAVQGKGARHELALKYFQVNPRAAATVIDPGVRVVGGSFENAPPRRGDYTDEIAKPRDGTESSRGTIIPAKDLHGDPRALDVGMYEWKLITHDPAKKDPKHAAYAIDTLYSEGYSPCTGIMFEGKDFALVSHLVDARTSPPAETIKFFLKQISDSGLSTEGMKVRIVGGEDYFEELPATLVREAKKAGLNVVETDTLGRTPRSFGYRLTGTGTRAFRVGD